MDKELVEDKLYQIITNSMKEKLHLQSFTQKKIKIRKLQGQKRKNNHFIKMYSV